MSSLSAGCLVFVALVCGRCGRKTSGRTPSETKSKGWEEEKNRAGFLLRPCCLKNMLRPPLPNPWDLKVGVNKFVRHLQCFWKRLKTLGDISTCWVGCLNNYLLSWKQKAKRTRGTRKEPKAETFRKKNLRKPERDIGGNSLRSASLEPGDRAVTSWKPPSLSFHFHQFTGWVLWEVTLRKVAQCRQ